MAGAESLPHVDEHAVAIEAAPDAAWEAVSQVAERSFASGTATRLARLLGCADAGVAGPRPLAPGSAFPGFHVEAAERPRKLALAGSHRFSQYALIFRLDDLGGGRTRLRAETRARFPGLKGRAYRALVIGNGGHVIATRRIIDAAKRRAERAAE